MILPAPVSDVLNRTFLDNSVKAWMAAAVTAAIIFLVLVVVRHVLVSRIGRVAARTTNQVDDMVVDMLEHTRIWVLFFASILGGIHALELGRAGPFIDRFGHLLLLWQIAVWGGAAVTFWTKHHLERRTASNDRASIAMISALAVGAKVVVWAIVLTAALYNVFGINPTSLITTLGVGGIAIALAVQNILGDLLAALSIVFDKPFDVGDTIGVDSITGTVEHIGLKTTRLRSVSGEQVIIGNSDLLKSRLRNYRRMFQRRVVFGIDVTYDTNPTTLAALPGTLAEIVSAQPGVRFDRAHVVNLGESAIHLEVVYFVLDPDFTLYRDAHQAILLEVLRRFGERKVSFAFPSRTVYHEGVAGAKPIGTD